MAYVITKTTGERLTVVQDGTINNSTDLTLIGRNFPNFGQIQNQNFVKLLENFASARSPSKPIRGQLWYDSGAKKLKVFNGSKFKGIPVVDSSAIRPTDQGGGDLWFNTEEEKLYYFDGSTYTLIGPQFSGLEAQNGIVPAQVVDTSGFTHYILKHRVQNRVSGSPDTVAITAAEDFTLASEPGFTLIKRGITFSNASSIGDSVNGVSGDTILWGTAADAQRLGGVNAADFVRVSAPTMTAGLSIGTVTASPAININSNSFKLTVDATQNASLTVAGNLIRFYVNDTFDILNLDGGATKALLPNIAGADVNIGSVTNPFKFVYAEATSARYADLAERYRADAPYEPGTVLKIGGTEEVTICNTYEDEHVAGIVSANPAYGMNDDIQPTERCPFIALKGRVPVKIKGPCKKGDILVTSDFPGHAEVRRTAQRPNPLGVLGKALHDFDGDFGIVEVMVI